MWYICTEKNGREEEGREGVGRELTLGRYPESRDQSLDDGSWPCQFTGNKNRHRRNGNSYFRISGDLLHGLLSTFASFRAYCILSSGK